MISLCMQSLCSLPTKQPLVILRFEDQNFFRLKKSHLSKNILNIIKKITPNNQATTASKAVHKSYNDKVSFDYEGVIIHKMIFNYIISNYETNALVKIIKILIRISAEMETM